MAITYTGRFAPSPTGPLHAGSLASAMASYLDARAHQGRWLVRIEDVDQTRCDAQTAQHQLQTLTKLGFDLNEPVVYQSQRTHLYEQALGQLQQLNLTYQCICTRSQIRAAGGLVGPTNEIVYPGTCRHRNYGLSTGAARLNLSAPKTGQVLRKAEHFMDRVVGPYSQDLIAQVGDFVLRRADRLFAYQLAVVVDDADQGVTHIVRGLDLLDNTPRQRLLHSLLGNNDLNYAHVPLVLGSDGQKLSKQNGAAALKLDNPERALGAAAKHLGLEVAPTTSLNQFWELATAAWASAYHLKG
jgi:glutamyl-Q tRNA(Asp) synthetase